MTPPPLFFSPCPCSPPLWPRLDKVLRPEAAQRQPRATTSPKTTSVLSNTKAVPTKAKALQAPAVAASAVVLARPQLAKRGVGLTGRRALLHARLTLPKTTLAIQDVQALPRPSSVLSRVSTLLLSPTAKTKQFPGTVSLTVKPSTCTAPSRMASLPPTQECRVWAATFSSVGSTPT